MLKTFLNFIKIGHGGEELGADRKHAAAAALLVEAARLDRKFDASEHEALKKIISDKFGLAPEAAQALISVAEGENKIVYDDRMFLDGIKQGFTEKEKLDLIEMLWEIALADRNLHALEEYLVWHTAEALGISHEKSQQARAAATANIA
ncbi:MAG: TerB family tellurite resistance protein [Parvibaculum sp.]